MYNAPPCRRSEGPGTNFRERPGDDVKERRISSRRESERATVHAGTAMYRVRHTVDCEIQGESPTLSKYNITLIISFLRLPLKFSSLSTLHFPASYDDIIDFAQDRVNHLGKIHRCKH